ncbi:MAG: thioredoxin family protein [Chloroflexi bacterium]|nr:thioredoxin family protein [Chloroflexota bacterium]
MKPIVDGIEARYGEQLVVLRVDVITPAGWAVGREFGFQYTPTFIFFDANGQEAWRSVGILDEAQIFRSMEP